MNRIKSLFLYNALNVDTGKKDYYIYNKESNSLILYDKDIYQPYQKVKNDEKLSLMAALKKSGGLVYFVSLAGTAFIFLITTIALLAKNRKLKKAYAIAGPANYDNDFEEGDTLTEIDQEELNKRYDEFLEKNVPEEDEDEKTIKELFSEKDSTDNYDELSKIIDEDLTITQIRKNKLKKKKKD